MHVRQEFMNDRRMQWYIFDSLLHCYASFCSSWSSSSWNLPCQHRTSSDLLPNCCNQSYQSDIKWADPEWLPEIIDGVSECFPCFPVKYLRNTSEMFAICYDISFFFKTTDNGNHLSCLFAPVIVCCVSDLSWLSFHLFVLPSHC